MILFFLVLLAVLLLLIGVWKRKATYGKILIGLGVLLIGIFFFGPFGIFYSCERYSNYLKNELQKINKPCENNDDCKLISYFSCKPYCINKDVDLSAFYSLQRKRPWSCPLYRCIAPEVKWRCICENNVCTVEEKEVAEEIEHETANWKTYRNEEYGFEIKYPENWAGTVICGRIEGSGCTGTLCFNPSGNSCPGTGYYERFLDIAVYPIYPFKSFDEYMKEVEALFHREDFPVTFQDVLISKKELVIDGSKAIERIIQYSSESRIDLSPSWVGRKMIIVYIPIHLTKGKFKDNIIQLSVPAAMSEIFNQMLSTFRFLE